MQTIAFIPVAGEPGEVGEQARGGSLHDLAIEPVHAPARLLPQGQRVKLFRARSVAGRPDRLGEGRGVDFLPPHGIRQPEGKLAQFRIRPDARKHGEDAWLRQHHTVGHAEPEVPELRYARPELRVTLRCTEEADPVKRLRTTRSRPLGVDPARLLLPAKRLVEAIVSQGQHRAHERDTPWFGGWPNLPGERLVRRGE